MSWRSVLGKRKRVSAGKMETAERRVRAGTVKRRNRKNAKASGWQKTQKIPVFGKIPVTASRGILFLDIEQIVYAETDGHGCLVHTTARSCEINQFLGELEKKLVPYGFSDP